MAFGTRPRSFGALVAAIGLACAMASADAQTPLEPGRVAGAQPVGLFYRVAVATVGPRRVDTRTWLFLPGDRVSRVYPFGGAFDSARCGPDTCGRYQMAAGQLTVRWDGGRVLQWTFAATTSGITLDGDLYRPARPMPAPALVGRWADAGDGGTNLYTFDGNGRFSLGPARAVASPEPTGSRGSRWSSPSRTATYGAARSSPRALVIRSG